ncbi:MAG: PH domain-containing protein [Thermotogota bacterium]
MGIKRKKFIRFIVMVGVLGLVFFTFVSKISVNNNYIKGYGIFSFKIEIENIKSLKIIEEDINIGMKIFGAGLGNTLKGIFDIEYYGKTTLYINKKSLDHFIRIITKDNKVYLINEHTAEKTKKLYNIIYDEVINLESYNSK